MKKRQITLPWLFLGAALLYVGCQKTGHESTPAIELTPTGTWTSLKKEVPMEKMSINALVQKQLLSGDVFHWSKADDYTVWSAAMGTDSIFSIGYQPLNYKNLDATIHELDLQAPQWLGTRKAIENLITAGEKGRQAESAVILYTDEKLPYLNARITNFETVAKLRRIAQVRYVDPMGYGTEVDPREKSGGSGCGDNAGNPSLSTTFYSPVSVASTGKTAKASWNFPFMNIEKAWALSSGDNVKVGVIDTGVDPDQDRLSTQFASGDSRNRTINKEGVFVSGALWWAAVDGPNDDCGHGTSMAGIVAAPRTETNAVGVAYNADLHCIRATDDVVINDSNEKNGVTAALKKLADISSVKIISMSLGDAFYSGQIADAVKYAYNKKKLMFFAAGTSLSWTTWYGVIFPASMPEAQAITGIKNQSPYAKCTICHSGAEVDYVVVMEDGDRFPITLAESGSHPSITGGSSAATATMAGISALVWAKKPTLTREQVLDRLTRASTNYPSNKSSEYGWGIVDAYKAVTLATQ